MVKHKQILIALLALLVGIPAAAAPPAPSADADSPWRLGVALGYGMRTNPLVLSDDVPIVVDVDIAWFGRRWFFDNGDGGFTFIDSERVTLSAIGRINSDRLFFTKTNTGRIRVLNADGSITFEQAEVPDRDYAIEAGVELLTGGEWGFLQASALHDVSGEHDGYELHATIGRSFAHRRWMIQPSVGASFKSRRLNDHYWGVRDEEASAAFPAYRAGSGLNGHARLLTSFQINRHWAFIAVLEYERMNGEAAASPIVRERHVRGAYVGFRYGF